MKLIDKIVVVAALIIIIFATALLSTTEPALCWLILYPMIASGILTILAILFTGTAPAYMYDEDEYEDPTIL